MKVNSIPSFKGKVEIKLERGTQTNSLLTKNCKGSESIIVPQLLDPELTRLIGLFERTGPEGDVLTLTVKGADTQNPKYSLDAHDLAEGRVGILMKTFDADKQGFQNLKETFFALIENNLIDSATRRY